MNKDNSKEESRDPLIFYEDEIKASLASGFACLRFPAVVEELYQKADLPVRFQRYFILGWASIIIYNLFCLGDYLMLSDVFPVAWFIRLCTVTPLMLIALFLLKKKLLLGVIEYLISFIIFTAAVSIIVMLYFSAHHNSIHYYTGIFIVAIFGNIVMRLRFYHALAVSILIQLFFTFSIQRVIPISPEASINASLVLVTTIVISLIANYRIEKELRRVFLLNSILKIDSIKLEESNRILTMLSLSDPITGLSNRRYFDATLDREVKAAARYKNSLSLVFLDIDYFKGYNDSYGHQAGDICLKNIADAIKSSVQRPRDVCARYGGEEFVVLLPGTDLKGAEIIAEALRAGVESLNITHESSPIAGHVTVSIGVSELKCEKPGDGARLIENADRALYLAKSEGRNRTCRFCPET